MEGLLNYVYYQAGALNSYDAVGHLLHFTLYDVNTGPCGNFSTGHDPQHGRPGRALEGRRQDHPAHADRAVRLVARPEPAGHQPGPRSRSPTTRPSARRGISPNNAAARAICDPNSKTKQVKATPLQSRPGAKPSGSSSHASPTRPTGPGGATGPAGGPPTTTTPQTPLPPTPGGTADPGGTIKHLRDLLGLGGGGGSANGSGGLLGGVTGGLKSSRTDGRAANDLLNFMFSN